MRVASTGRWVSGKSCSGEIYFSPIDFGGNAGGLLPSKWHVLAVKVRVLTKHCSSSENFP